MGKGRVKPKLFKNYWTINNNNPINYVNPSQDGCSLRLNHSNDFDQ